jgi:hypothetical protein
MKLSFACYKLARALSSRTPGKQDWKTLRGKAAQPAQVLQDTDGSSGNPNRAHKLPSMRARPLTKPPRRHRARSWKSAQWRVKYKATANLGL